nr:MAG TPA: hypothetical protein [Caudoviricetes sp.]
MLLALALPDTGIPISSLTLTSGMSQFGPATGSLLGDSGPHHDCGLYRRSIRVTTS